MRTEGINGFAGINTTDDPTRIKQSELIKCENVRVLPDGTLKRKLGMIKFKGLGQVDTAEIDGIYMFKELWEGTKIRHYFTICDGRIWQLTGTPEWEEVLDREIIMDNGRVNFLTWKNSAYFVNGKQSVKYTRYDQITLEVLFNDVSQFVGSGSDEWDSYIHNSDQVTGPPVSKEFDVKFLDSQISAWVYDRITLTYYILGQDVLQDKWFLYKTKNNRVENFVELPDLGDDSFYQWSGMAYDSASVYISAQKRGVAPLHVLKYKRSDLSLEVHNTDVFTNTDINSFSIHYKYSKLWVLKNDSIGSKFTLARLNPATLAIEVTKDVGNWLEGGDSYGQLQGFDLDFIDYDDSDLDNVVVFYVVGGHPEELRKFYNGAVTIIDDTWYTGAFHYINKAQVYVKMSVTNEFVVWYSKLTRPASVVLYTVYKFVESGGYYDTGQNLNGASLGITDKELYSYFTLQDYYKDLGLRFHNWFQLQENPEYWYEPYSHATPLPPFSSSAFKWVDYYFIIQDDQDEFHITKIEAKRNFEADWTKSTAIYFNLTRIPYTIKKIFVIKEYWYNPGSYPGRYYLFLLKTIDTPTTPDIFIYDNGSTTPDPTKELPYQLAEKTPLYIEMHQNHLFICGANSSLLEWTDAYTDIPFTGFEPIAEDDGDVCTGIKAYQGRLLFFKRNSIWAMDGIVDSHSISKIKTNYGCVSANTIQLIVNEMVFLSEKGFCLFYGNNVKLISDKKIKSFFRYGQKDSINIEYIKKSYSVMDFENNEYKCYVPLNDSTECNYCIIWNFINNTWYTEDKEVEVTALAGIEDENDLPQILIGTKEGSVNQDNAGNTHDGTDIKYEIMTKKFDAKDPSLEKFFRKLIINSKEWLELAGAYRVNDREWIPFLLQQKTDLDFVTNIIRVSNGRGKTIQIKFIGRDSNTPFEINGIEFKFKRLRTTGRGRSEGRYQ